MKKLCAMVLSIMVCLCVSAQDDPKQTPTLSVQIFAGPALSFPSGNTRAELKDQSDEYGYYVFAETESSSHLNPFLGAQIGVHMYYPLANGLSVGSGLRLTRKGWQVKARETYYDADYQYEEKFRFTGNARLDYLEIPFLARYSMGKVSVVAGLGLGFALQRRFVKRETLTREVNGSRYDRLQSRYYDRMGDVGIVAGFLELGGTYQLTQHWAATFGIQQDLGTGAKDEIKFSTFLLKAGMAFCLGNIPFQP